MMSPAQTDQAIVRLIESEYFLGQQPHEIFKKSSTYKVHNSFTASGKRLIPRVFLTRAMAFYMGTTLQNCRQKWWKSFIDLVATRSRYFLVNLQYHISQSKGDFFATFFFGVRVWVPKIPSHLSLRITQNFTT